MFDVIPLQSFTNIIIFFKEYDFYFFANDTTNKSPKTHFRKYLVFMKN